MKFYRQAPGKPHRVGILAGSFNPPTIAHRELALAASRAVDLIVCVVPEAFPHKSYSGATLEQRVEMLQASALNIPHAIATTRAGLFIDIAGEVRSHFGAQVELVFICGRDAAERILEWDYGRAGVVEEMLAQFELLVAPRRGEDFSAPGQFGHRIQALAMPAGHELVSSTEVRERIARGEAWEHLVPGDIRERVREIYSCKEVSRNARKR